MGTQFITPSGKKKKLKSAGGGRKEEAQKGGKEATHVDSERRGSHRLNALQVGRQHISMMKGGE